MIFIIGDYLVMHGLIVKFDYDLIEKAIETIIDEIEEYGHDVM